MESESFIDKIRNILNQEVPIDDVKEEVWQDLADIYYKYDDEIQKKAFREIMNEISEIEWRKIYSKIYAKKDTKTLK